MISASWFRKRAAGHIIAILIVASGLFAYNTMRVDAKLETTTPFLVSTRDRLRMCMQVSPALAARSDTVRAQLARSLLSLRSTHPDWESTYGNIDPPALESGCNIKIPTTTLDPNDQHAVGLGTVRNPTPFRTVFLVIDDKTADTVLGPRKSSLAPYEMMLVSEHENAEVTTALVVRERDLSDREVIDQYLAVAVGLLPITPFAPPPGEKSPTIKPPGHDAGS